MTLGSIIGYTGFAAGLNFLLINYYRDRWLRHGAHNRLSLLQAYSGGEKQEVLPRPGDEPERVCRRAMAAFGRASLA